MGRLLRRAFSLLIEHLSMIDLYSAHNLCRENLPLALHANLKGPLTLCIRHVVQSSAPYDTI